MFKIFLGVYDQFKLTRLVRHLSSLLFYLICRTNQIAVHFRRTAAASNNLEAYVSLIKLTSAFPPKPSSVTFIIPLKWFFYIATSMENIETIFGNLQYQAGRFFKICPSVTKLYCSLMNNATNYMGLIYLSTCWTMWNIY